MITGNESYFPVKYTNADTNGITIKQKFIMDWVNTHMTNFGYNYQVCLSEANIAFTQYLKYING